MSRRNQKRSTSASAGIAPDRRGRSPGVMRVLTNLALLGAVAGSLIYWGWSPRTKPGSPPASPTVVESPPAPRFEVSESGAPVAHIDVDRLTAWCRSNGLPDPPEIRTAEPAVAKALIEALRVAATTRSPMAFGTVARICEALDCFRNAEDYAQRAADGDLTAFPWRYLLGCIQQETGQRDEAARSFLEALRLNPDYPIAHARLAQIYLESDRPDDAERHLDRFVSASPRDWLGPVGLGRVALMRRQPDAALRHLLRAVELGPGDFQAHYHLGRAYAAKGEAALAKSEFELASRLPKGGWFRDRDPLLREADDWVGGVSSLSRRFEQMQDTGDWAALAELAEQIITRRPDDTTMMGNLASIYRKLERFDAAHEVLDRGLKLKPESPRLRGLRSEVFFSAGDHEEAVSTARAAIEIDPENASAYNVLARSFYVMERLTEAVAAMRRAVELDPDDAGKVFVLGEMLRPAGFTDEAAECYRRTLQLQPNHAHARQRLAASEQSPSRDP